MAPRQDNRGPIIATLREYGPMTAREVAELLGWPMLRVDSTIASARWHHPGKYFKIIDYLPIVGRRGRDLCVFSAKPGPDVPREPANPEKDRARRSAALARYRAKNRMAISASNKLRKARQRGTLIKANPWEQLAQPSTRATMTKVMQPKIRES